MTSHATSLPSLRSVSRIPPVVHMSHFWRGARSNVARHAINVWTGRASREMSWPTATEGAHGLQITIKNVPRIQDSRLLTRIWIRTTQKGEGRMLRIFPAIGLSSPSPLAQAQPNFTPLWNPRDRISCCVGLCSFQRNTLSFFLSFFLASSFVIHHVHVGRRHSTPTPSKFLTPRTHARARPPSSPTRSLATVTTNER